MIELLVVLLFSVEGLFDATVAQSFLEDEARTSL